MEWNDYRERKIFAMRNIELQKMANEYRGSRHSMKQRKIGHDYYAPCIYMLTLVVEDRRPLFGFLKYEKDSLLSDNPNVKVIYSELGRKLRSSWINATKDLPIKLHWIEIMPDHIHLVVQVIDRLPIHLPNVVGKFKAEINSLYKLFFPEAKLPDSKSDKGMFFEHGFCDSILQGNDQLDRWFRYVKNNPLRIALKRCYPNLFRTQFNIKIGTGIYNIIGNKFLIEYPHKIQVRVSRKLSEDEIKGEVKKYLELAKEGFVLVSPAISEGEKAVMRTALEAGYPLIFISHQNIDEFSKISHHYDKACVEGKFLTIASTAIPKGQKFTRLFCNFLNDTAKYIAGC